MAIDWAAAQKGLCVVCGEPISSAGAFVCRSCGRRCEVFTVPLTRGEDTLVLVDIRSRCCRADVDTAKKITCSDKCHERFVGEMEHDFGSVKIIVDATTGRRHVVPTRVIIEKGIRQEELASYPEAQPP